MASRLSSLVHTPHSAHTFPPKYLVINTDKLHRQIHTHYLAYTHFNVCTMYVPTHHHTQTGTVTGADRLRFIWIECGDTLCNVSAMTGTAEGDHFATESKIEFVPSRGWHVTRPSQSKPDRIKRSAISQRRQATTSRWVEERRSLQGDEDGRGSRSR